MKTKLHIERLILEGLPVGSHDGLRLLPAVERELARLLGAHGISGELQQGAALETVRVGTLNFSRGVNPRELGTRIGKSIFQAIGGQT